MAIAAVVPDQADDLGFRPSSPAQSDDLGFRPAKAAPVAPPAPVAAEPADAPSATPTASAPPSASPQPAASVSAYEPTLPEQLRDEVANSAIGRSLQSTMPKVASALHLTPSESDASPTYEQHATQLLAPEYEAPFDAEALHLRQRNQPAQPITPGQNRVAGALAAEGNLTSGKSLATIAGTGAAAAATAGVINPASAQLLGRLVSGGFTADMLHGLYQQHAAYRQAIDSGNTAEAQKIQGEMGVNGVMALLSAAHTAGLTPHVEPTTGEFGAKGIKLGNDAISADLGFRPAYRQPSPEGSYGEGSTVVPGKVQAGVTIAGKRFGTSPEPAPAVAEPESAAPNVTPRALPAETGEPPVIQGATDGAAVPAPVTPEEPTVNPPVQESPSSGKNPEQKPLYEMSSDEISGALKEATHRDSTDLTELFGEEGGKRYAKLQRAANNAFDTKRADAASEEIGRMEDALTPDQRDRLYGIGDERHQVEGLREYDSALSRIGGGTPDELAESMKYAVSRVDDPGADPATMRPDQQVAYAQLRQAFEIASREGWDTGEIIHKAIRLAAKRFRDPEDAAFMLEKVARAVAPVSNRTGDKPAENLLAAENNPEEKGDSGQSPEQAGASAPATTSEGSNARMTPVNPEIGAGDKQGTPERTTPALPYETGEPATIPFMRNTEGAQQYAPGGKYNEIVPGRYMVERSEGINPPDARWQTGTVKFKKPIVLDFGGGYADETNWKRVLSKRYGGKTGEALSNALRADGYDGIITHDKYGTAEIVDLATGDASSASSNGAGKITKGASVTLPDGTSGTVAWSMGGKARIKTEDGARRDVPLKDLKLREVNAVPEAEKPNAVQEESDALPEQSPARVLQRQPEEVGVSGSERGRMEPGEQGREEPAPAREQQQAEPVRSAQPVEGETKEVVPGRENEATQEESGGVREPAAVEPGTSGAGEPRPKEVATTSAASSGSSGEGVGNPQPGSVGRAPLSELAVDPKRFQYKLNTDESGATAKLKGVGWNDELSGIITAWRDPADGKTYVVNGHHRYELAKRFRVPDLAVRMLSDKVHTAGEARVVGAMQNIAEGNGTAVDAAKFLRDTGRSIDDLKRYGISPDGTLADGAAALAKLDQKFFDDVVAGRIPERRGIAIAKAAETPEQQEALVKMIAKAEAKGRTVTNATIEELGRMVNSADTVTTTQDSLFGAQQRTQNTALEKAEVSAYLRNQIAQEKKLFAGLSSTVKAEKIGEVGKNRIDAGENQKVASRAEQAQEIYDRLSTRTGPVNDILNQAAKRIAEGENANTIKSEAYRAIRTALSEAIGGGDEAAGRSVSRDVARPEDSGKEVAKPAAAEEQPAKNPVKEPALPGMEEAVRKQDESAADVQREGIEQNLAAPKDDISKAAGEMERNSPLFRDSEASGQGGLFGDELQRRFSEDEESGRVQALKDQRQKVTDMENDVSRIGSDIQNKRIIGSQDVRASYFRIDDIRRNLEIERKRLARMEKEEEQREEDERRGAPATQDGLFGEQRVEPDEKASQAASKLGSTFYSGFADPELFKRLFPDVASRIGDWLSDEVTPGSQQKAMMRDTRGTRDRQLAVVIHKLDNTRREWNRRSRADTIAFVNAVEGYDGAKISDLPEKDQAFANLVKGARDMITAEMRQLNPDFLSNFIENYWPRAWEQESSVHKTLKNLLNGKRPFAGKASFLKKRTIPYFQDGLDLGFKPKTWNPVEQAIMNYAEMSQYLMGHQTLHVMKDAGTAKFVRIGDDHPEGWTQLDDRIGTVFGKEENAKGDAFTIIRGHYYAPAEAAKVFNNFVSRGVAGRSGIYDSLNWVNQNLNALQLGISAFHAATTTINAATSDVALGIQQLAEGKPFEAGASIIKGASIVPSMVSTIRNGSKLLQEYLDPGSYAKFSAEANALAEAGGRVRQNTLEIKPLDQVISSWRNGAVKEGLSKLPAAILEATVRPVMEYYVPRMKVGAFYSMAHDVLEQAAKSGESPEKTRAKMQRAWDSVDNRFGQVVYDNFFWHKGLRDALQLSQRSVGWNFGDIRELGGGAMDTVKQAGRAASGERPEVTPRMAFALALPMVSAMIGGVLTYLWTGKKPDTWKDYFYPKTADGTRHSIPGYMKDVFAFGHAPVNTAVNKLAPIWALTADAVNNRDFYGTEIRHKDDPMMKQLGEFSSWAAKQAIPFSFSGAGKLLEKGGAEPTLAGMMRAAPKHMGDVALGQLGFNPAPASIQNTDAMNTAFDYARENRPPGTKTEDQANHQKAFSAVVKMYRSGQVDHDQIDRYRKEGKLPGNSVARAAMESRYPAIVVATRGLDIEQLLNVYEKGTQEEKNALRPVVARKYKSIEDISDPDRKQTVEAAYDRAINEGRNELASR